MFSCVAMKVEFSMSWFSISTLHYKKKLMIKIQGTLKLLIYDIERNPNKWKEKIESQ